MRLRETMRAAEKYIATGLSRFQELTGVSIASVELVRYPDGAYCPTIKLGPRVGSPADPAPQA